MGTRAHELDVELARDTYDLAGYRVDIGVPPGAERNAVRSVLRGFGPVAAGPPGDDAHIDFAPGSDGDWEARTGDTVFAKGRTLSLGLAALEWSIVKAALEHREDLFHLHGAALCLPTLPSGLALVGDSGKGKTTLTLGLMLRGFMPFADDVVLIDPSTLELLPFRRAFHIGDDTWRLLEELDTPLGKDEDAPDGYFSPPQWAARPVRVRWLLFVEHRLGQTPQLLPLPPAEAATAMLKQTQTLGRTPRLALATAARLTEHAECYRFLTGDLAASVAMVQRLVASPPRR